MPVHLANLWHQRHIEDLRAFRRLRWPVNCWRIANRINDKDLDMTMLTHAGGRYKPASYLSGRPEISGAITGGGHIAMLRQFCLSALVVLLIGGGVAGIIALKAMIALSRISY